MEFCFNSSKSIQREKKVINDGLTQGRRQISQPFFSMVLPVSRKKVKKIRSSTPNRRVGGSPSSSSTYTQIYYF